MPIYEYKCAKGHTFEVMQRMADDTLEKCITCGARVQRVFHPVAVHFKGSGFYNTDYGKQQGKGAKAETASTDSGSSSESKSSSSDNKSSSSDGAKSDKKAATKTSASPSDA